jgi:hypothetical protein
MPPTPEDFLKIPIYAILKNITHLLSTIGVLATP